MSVFRDVKYSMIKKEHEIMSNTTIIYIDGITEQFEAVRLTENGVIIGRIHEGKFMDCGFISKRTIKRIETGGKRKT
jgi:hypothetical protein